MQVFTSHAKPWPDLKTYLSDPILILKIKSFFLHLKFLQIGGGAFPLVFPPSPSPYLYFQSI